MKIASLSDFLDIQGGANITTKIFLDYGKFLGYEIKQFDRNNSIEEMEGFDLYILNNVNGFKFEKIQWIIDNKKYVKIEHDYCFCEFRNAKCESCPKMPCQPAKIFTDLFANSLLNVFFSPLQFKIFRKYFGALMRKDAMYLPAPIEKDMFKPMGKKTKKYLFAGAIMNHKGIFQILDWAKANDTKIDIVGKAVNKDAMQRIKDEGHNYLGEKDHSEMPTILAQYENLMINPQMNESFGLIMLEALASGCTIIKFPKSYETGLESYYGTPTKELLELSYNSPKRLWERINEVIKNDTR